MRCDLNCVFPQTMDYSSTTANNLEGSFCQGRCDSWMDQTDAAPVDMCLLFSCARKIAGQLYCSYTSHVSAALANRFTNE